LEAGLSNAGESVETDQSGLSQGAGVVRSKPPVLAKPGTLATLTMFGQNVRVTTTVVPLQPGAKGQSILVRDVSSERVITAEVVDVNLLQVRF
jgi:flagella basal body P-ring formation protein FlgA